MGELTAKLRYHLSGIDRKIQNLESDRKRLIEKYLDAMDERDKLEVKE